MKKSTKKCRKTGKKGVISALLSAHIKRVSVSRMQDFLDGFPELVYLHFNNNNKTASSFPRLAPHHLPGIAPLTNTALRAPCHLGKGEGNENREVEKVEVAGRRGWGEEEDRDQIPKISLGHLGLGDPSFKLLSRNSWRY